MYLIRRHPLDTAVSGLSVLVVSRTINVITGLLFLNLGLVTAFAMHVVILGFSTAFAVAAIDQHAVLAVTLLPGQG